MASENVRDRKERRRYTFVVIPGVDSERTRTFSVSVPVMLAAAVSSFLVIVVLITAAIVYTPIGSRLPAAGTELEKQYGTQIAEIQSQLSTLLKQMDVLRAYNLRLRIAMGEKMTPTESSIVASGVPNQMYPRQYETITGTSTPAESLPPHSAGNESYVASSRTVGYPLALPAEGYRTRGFEPEQSHFGIDIAGKQGSTILAAADGNVIFSGWTYDDGLMVMLAHDQGLMTVYKHTKALLKSPGTTVRRGEAIALLGNTGRTSSGPHLHFEVWKNGVAKDPNGVLVNIQ